MTNTLAYYNCKLIKSVKVNVTKKLDKSEFAVTNTLAYYDKELNTFYDAGLMIE